MSRNTTFSMVWWRGGADKIAFITHTFINYVWLRICQIRLKVTAFTEKIYQINFDTITDNFSSLLRPWGIHLINWVHFNERLTCSLLLVWFCKKITTINY